MADGARPKVKIACLLSGTGTTMAALLYAAKLPDCPYEIVLVASNVPDAPGLALAEAEGIPTFARNHLGLDRRQHERIMDEALRESGAEYLALCGYLRILTGEFVEGWRDRMVNTHPSLLPAYKGLDTHARALEAGETHGGCSVHVVTAELDAGPLLGQVAVAILPGDRPETLQRRVQLAEYQLFPWMLAQYVSRPFRADWLLEQVRERALTLPEAEEQESHGSAGWRTAGKSGKFFAYFADQHHGSPNIALIVKAADHEELVALVEQDPETYFKPAYYGASGWIGIILNRADVDWSHVEDWLERSWRAVAPRRLTALRDAADAF
jgi:phosphoribosylglycinamide formyltransferase-1